jgi:hypothetical protein
MLDHKRAVFAVDSHICSAFSELSSLRLYTVHSPIAALNTLSWLLQLGKDVLARKPMAIDMEQTS